MKVPERLKKASTGKLMDKLVKISRNDLALSIKSRNEHYDMDEALELVKQVEDTTVEEWSDEKPAISDSMKRLYSHRALIERYSE